MSLTAMAGPVPLTLMYDHPATSWMTEALPIGNGRLGAMIFGGTETERIQFNENSLWTGREVNTEDSRALGSYQAFGDIHLSLPGHAQPTDYRRDPGHSPGRRRGRVSGRGSDLPAGVLRQPSRSGDRRQADCRQAGRVHGNH